MTATELYGRTSENSPSTHLGELASGRVTHPIFHPRFIAMCSPSGCEPYTTRQHKIPSKLPRTTPAKTHRRWVAGSKRGSGASDGIRVVGDDDPWQPLPTSYEIPPIRGRVPAGRYNAPEALGGWGLLSGGRNSPHHLAPAGSRARKRACSWSRKAQGG